MQAENINETVMDNDLQDDQQEKPFDPYEQYELDGDKIIVPLKHPVKTAKREFTELRIRPPYGADLRVAGNAKNDMDNGLILLERCAEGATKEVINKMRPVDIQAASEVLGFLSQE